MKIDKLNFFKIIDGGNHLNEKTREAAWDFFVKECGEDFGDLLQKTEQLFPGSGLHLYIATSLEHKMNINENESFDKKTDIIKPISADSDKETAASWGTNDDVRGK